MGVFSSQVIPKESFERYTPLLMDASLKISISFSEHLYIEQSQEFLDVPVRFLSTLCSVRAGVIYWATSQEGGMYGATVTPT
jgi:hypothetical protein